MGWEPKTTVMAIGGSFSLSVEMAGSKATVRGTVGLVETVRIGGNGIAAGAMNVLTASIIPVINAEAFRTRMIRGRGMKCEKPSYNVST